MIQVMAHTVHKESKDLYFPTENRERDKDREGVEPGEREKREGIQIQRSPSLNIRLVR